MGSYAQQLKAIELAKKKLEAKTFRTIEKAMKSDNPSDMIAANEAAVKIANKPLVDNSKAFLIDPLQFNAMLGYKDKPFALSYRTLQRMAKTPIMSAIIKTRKNQIADFAEPQADRYNTGFVIKKKPKDGIEQKMSAKDEKIANAITDFIINCGSSSSWVNDDFDTFIRKIVDDSLTFDQMTFECVRNRRGQLESFTAVDASTFRIADTAFKEDYKNKFFDNRGSGLWYNNSLRDLEKEQNGYLPQYVQIYQNAVVNEFYPWELCFGVRNPSTSIYSNGYGCSEMEELINVITSMLWGDEYNRRFFSQGSAPKGLLRVKGGMNEQALQQFRQQWQAMISGVMQSWKTPVVDADVEWIDLQKNNRDMEYSSWMEYLIKQACAIYSIDPSEIGWDISRSGGNAGLFEGNQAERLQHSKDKGLYPMLKFIQRKINKYIVSQINPEFEFVFMGLNGMTVEQELEQDIKKLNSFMTVNEIRRKYDLPEIEENGEVIENSIFYQNLQANKMREQQEQQQEQGGDNGGFNFDDWGNDDEEEDNNENSSEEENKKPDKEEKPQNPFDRYNAGSSDENSSDKEDNENEEESEEQEDNDGEHDEEDEYKEKSESRSIFVKAFEDFLSKEENKDI